MTIPIRPGNPPTIDRFDVVIIAFNNPDITTRAVISVLYTEPSARVILIDNGSSEPFKGLASLLRGSGHKYIRLPRNIGPYGAANAGISEVETDQFIFMCNDSAVLPGNLRALLKKLSPVTPYVSASEVQSNKFDPSYHMKAVPAPDNSVLEPGAFFTCFAAKTAFVKRVGAFDDRFKLTFGDTDWEQRANDLLAPSGGCLLQARDIRVFHGASVTRKRLGLEADLQVDTLDHKTFREIWASRPDVLSKHPVEDFSRKKSFTQREWAAVGEK